MISRVIGTGKTVEDMTIDWILGNWTGRATAGQVAGAKEILGLDPKAKLGRPLYPDQDRAFGPHWEMNASRNDALGIPMPPKPNGSRSSPSHRLLIHLNGGIVGSVIWVHDRNDVWVMFY